MICLEGLAPDLPTMNVIWTTENVFQVNNLL